MHMGETTGPDTDRPFATLGDRDDGAVSPDGRVMGTYLHGLFARSEARAALLARLGQLAGGADYDSHVDAALDEIAAELERHLAIDALLDLARSAGDAGKWSPQ